MITTLNTLGMFDVLSVFVYLGNTRKKKVHLVLISSKTEEDLLTVCESKIKNPRSSARNAVRVKDLFTDHLYSFYERKTQSECNSFSFENQYFLLGRMHIFFQYMGKLKIFATGT